MVQRSWRAFLAVAVVALFVAMALAACSSATPAEDKPSAGADADSSGANGGTDLQRDWIATDIVGEPVPTGVTPTIVFADGEASGNNGCNQWGASYEVTEDGGLLFGQARSTLMACEGPGAKTEASFSEAIRLTQSYEASSGTLTLLDEAGDPLMKLTAAA